MKNIFTLVLLFSFFQIQLGISQCPPAGFPSPGNTCPEAPVLCPDLDGYCATVNNNNIQQNFPGCNSNVLNNDEWFAFFAGTTTIEIEVVPSNCDPGSFQGLQGGIYAGCMNMASNIMDVQCACTEDPFTLFSTQYVVGEIYWFVLDGCAGNVCDYTINVLQGSTVGVPPDDPTGPINGPDTVCVNTSDDYSIAPVPAATIYNWDLNPALGTISGDDENITINWGAVGGTTELCLTVENFCFANPNPICTTIEVVPEPTAQISGSGELCAGGSASIDLQIDFTGTPAWQFVYSIDGVPQPPIITSDNPYTLTVTDPGSYQLVSVATVGGMCEGTVSGTVDITQLILDASATIEDATCTQDNGSIDLTPNNGEAPFTFIWSNGDTTEDLDDVGPGSYSVTVTDANGCEGEFQFMVGDEPNEPSVSDTTVDSECGNANGDIDITVTGGDSPYTYIWSNGATTEDLDDVEAGSYTVTVTGADGCTQVHTVTLSNTDPPISISANIVGSTTCAPIAGNGSIDITISPQPAPGGGSYTINWSTGDVDVTSLTDLAPGSYSVTVTTGTSCEGTATFTVPDEPNEPSLTSSIEPSECGLDNGDIDISVSGGVTPYTFNWSNGATTEDLNDIPAGAYSVTVTAANGCTDDLSINLTNNNPPISISSNITPNTSCPPVASNGGIDITISPQPAPGNGTYDITWSNGGSGTSQTDLPPGSYSVTVSAGGECSEVATFTVPDEPDLPSINPTVTPATCGLSNGGIDISISGGVQPYDIMWSTGGTTTPIIDIAGGSYGVTVTGANGCSTSTQITVPDNPILFTITPTIEANTSCLPPNNGSVSISVSPPGNYTYTWSTGETTTEIINQPDGSYSVTVSAGGNCTQVANFTIPLEPDVPTLNPEVTPSTCGQNNGEATIFVSGGISPLTYIWSNGDTGPFLTNVPSGGYSVTVTAGNGCSISTAVTIPNEDIPVSIVETITPNTSCLPPGNGAISISITPPDAIITWSNGSNSPNLTDLSAGTYSVTVDAGGTCTEMATFNVPDNSEIPQLNPTPTPSSCNQNDGAVTLDVIGGLAPLMFQWSNGETTQNLTDILAGTYSVTVTTAGGCTAETTVNVPNNDIIFTVGGFATGNSSCSFPNGNIQLTINPGGIYTYLWSTGETTPFISDLPAGSYQVTVSAGGTCTQVAVFDVFEFAFPPNLSTSASAATCGQDNGEVDLTVDGNNPPFTFDWSNGDITEDLSGVPPGFYEVTVTDAFGCTAITSATVGSNNIVINLSGMPSANTSCQSENGSIDLSISPAGTYDIIWSNGETTEDLSNLAAGSYSVTVSSGGDCVAEASYTVDTDTQDPEISETITGAICGEANGGVDISVTGSTTPFTFVWSNGETTEDISDLLPGDYTVTVTGADGCLAEATFNVPNNSSSFTINGIPSPLTSCDANNGSIDLSITPAGSYTIAWSNGETTEDLSGLDDGTYTVTVTESGSCEATASFVIDDETSFPTTSQIVGEELCGQENGSVDLTVMGTSTPFGYVWSSGQTTEDLNDIPAGIYEVTVTGANGCTATTTATVPDNTINFSVMGTPAANTSCDVNNGEIQLDVTPAGAYTFMWSNGETTEDIIDLAGGAYSVTVSAGGECTSVANFTVPSTTADPVLAQTISPSICGEADGGIDLDVTSGEAPFNFIWSNGETTEDLSDIPADAYAVTVTGANGCVVTGNFTVPDNAIVLNVDGMTDPNTSCDNVNGSVDISVTPSGTYEYIWSNGETSEDLSDLPPGNYTVTVTEGQNCTAESTLIVENETNAPDITSGISAATCGVDNGGIDLMPTGGTMPYAYVWSNGETTEDISDLLPGNYDVTITGDDGCSNTGSYTVPDDPINISIDASPAANTSCDMVNGAIDLTITPTDTYDIIWSNGETSEDLTNLPSGNYTVTVTLGQNCTAESTIDVDNDTNAPDLFDDITAAICGGATGDIDLSPTGGTMPYQFVWSNGETSEDLTDVLPGDYDVTITGDDGCSNTGSYNVPDDIVNIQLSGSEMANTLCVNGNGTIDLTVTPSGTYDIIWSNGETSEDLSDLPAGDYSVTVSAGGTCEAMASFTIADEPDVPTVSETITASICNQPDGGIDLDVMGGATPFQFMWSNGETTEDLIDITSGDYDVTVTSANGCTVMASFNVPNNSNTFSISGDASPNTLCGNSNGSIDLTITPAGSYGIEWSNGETTEDLADLPPGNYTVTVSDGGTCTASQTFTVDNTAPTVDVIGAETNILCFGATTGAIELTVSGGLDPYQFDWSPAIPGSPEDPMDLAAGQYDVTVTDASGCSGTASFNLTQPTDNVQISCSQTASVSAPGASDGTANVSISGGTAPYVVSWSPGGSQNGVAAGVFPIDNLTEGNYDVTVIDENGCETICDFLITSVDCEVVADLTATPTEILDCTVESITLIGDSSGSDDPTYEWFLNGVSLGMNQSLTINEGGDYVLIVTDAVTGCADTTDVTISDNTDFPPLYVDPAEDLNCFFPEITISGGSPISNVEFLWATIVGSDTTLIGSGDNTMVGEPGTYWLFGEADNGCLNGISITVDGDFSTPNANAGISFTIGCDSGDTYTLDGTSSTGDGTLTFAWETLDGLFADGQNTSTPGILDPGTYTLTVTQSSNGCTDDASVTIDTDGPQVDPQTIDPDCFGEDGTLILQDVEGGTPPYQYSIDGGASFTDQNVFFGLPSGQYEIVVMDEIGCDDDELVNIEQPDSFFVVIADPTVTVQIGDTYQINTQVSVPEGQIETVNWNPPTYLDCIDCLDPLANPEQTTNYVVTVVDSNGCEDTAPLLLVVNKDVNIYVPNAFSPNGDGTNDVFMIFANLDQVVEVKSFLVFSRWGESVFEYYDFTPNNPAFGWDGMHRGQPLNPAVFAWFAEIELLDGQTLLLEGDVTLMK